MERMPDRAYSRGLWERALSLARCAALACFVTGSHAAAEPPEPDAALERALQLSEAFVGLLRRVSPAVVLIAIEANYDLPQALRVPAAPAEAARSAFKPVGTGVVFRADGHLVTSQRLVEHAKKIEVMLKDGRRFYARPVGHDPAVDLAVLKIEADELPVANFGDSNQVRVGQWVLAIGAPFGLDYTLSAGVLNARGRGLGVNEIEDYLQTDAHIHPGNAGGPLIDLHGDVLGINTLAVGASGMGFAIPSNLVRSVGDQLIATQRVTRAWAGVSFQELTPDLAQRLGKRDTRGALVANVVANGPADHAGIHPGDVIEKIDAEDVARCKDLLHAILTRPIGSQARLTLRRDGRPREVTLIIDARYEGAATPAPSAAANAPTTDPLSSSELGLDLKPITPEIADELGYHGPGKVAVVGVRPGSRAEVGGIRRGDVIVEAERRAVENPDDVTGAAKDGKVMLRIDRKSGPFYTVLCRRE